MNIVWWRLCRNRTKHFYSNFSYCLRCNGTYNLRVLIHFRMKVMTHHNSFEAELRFKNNWAKPNVDLIWKRWKDEIQQKKSLMARNTFRCWTLLQLFTLCWWTIQYTIIRHTWNSVLCSYLLCIRYLLLVGHSAVQFQYKVQYTMKWTHWPMISPNSQWLNEADCWINTVDQISMEISMEIWRENIQQKRDV